MRISRLLMLVFALSAVSTPLHGQTEVDAWRTELDQDVQSLVNEIQERVVVLDQIQSKISDIDMRIERLEREGQVDQAQVKLLRDSRLRLAELNGIVRSNANEALSIIESYAQQLAEVIERSES